MQVQVVLPPVSGLLHFAGDGHRDGLRDEVRWAIIGVVLAFHVAALGKTWIGFAAAWFSHAFLDSSIPPPTAPSFRSSAP